jgi:hypothetical protein
MQKPCKIRQCDKNFLITLKYNRLQVGQKNTGKILRGGGKNISYYQILLVGKNLHIFWGRVMGGLLRGNTGKLLL